MPSRIVSIVKLVISVVMCELIGFTSGMLSIAGVMTWYSTLIKPSWNPPSYLFGPVWTALYFLMGISLWLVWNSTININTKLKAFGVFALQLALNFIWSILFFSYHSTALALVDIIAMVFLIAFTIFRFSPISKVAAWLLVPYLLWVSFASVLNYTIWMLN